VRFGIAILPERPWAEAERQWRAAEELGFDHAWTYDHLVWAGLPESPWYGTTPTLTAAAVVTRRIRLGTLVTSPNYRHPAALWRDVQSLDDISGGRFLLGVGNGGDLDSAVLGGAALSTRDRVDRFQEFTRLLFRVRAEDHVTSEGRWFSTTDMRTRPRVRDVPVLVAANGPRSVRFAARHGDGWITYGTPGADDLETWLGALETSATILQDALGAADRDPAAYPRYLSVDSSPLFSLSSVGAFEELTGHAHRLGFTDMVTHWPRPTDPYRGEEATLEAVAGDVLPRWHD
jgi:alkanesulfonate monooxygenase SsuD/methylene tetrahydromethanopterin reductase-like flavin-dependent oxidoreductase (luciferase family)